MAILSIVNMGSLLLSLVSTVGVKSQELIIVRDTIFENMVAVNSSSNFKEQRSFSAVRIKRDGRDHGL